MAERRESQVILGAAAGLLLIGILLALFGSLLYGIVLAFGAVLLPLFLRRGSE